MGAGARTADKKEMLVKKMRERKEKNNKNNSGNNNIIMVIFMAEKLRCALLEKVTFMESLQEAEITLGSI